MYWRTKDGEEVDFLIERGSRFIAIESKLSEQPQRRDIKGISDLKKYYGEAALIRGVIMCKSKGKYNYDYETIVDNGLHLKEVLE